MGHLDILFIAICSIICGGEGWEHMQTFGKARKDWLQTFLESRNGILQWVQEIATKTQGDIVAIDGKTLRGSGDKDKGVAPIHMVSAWSSCNQMGHRPQNLLI